MGGPSSLDLDLLRSFVLIAEGASFTRTAEQIGRTQSAVSLQIQRLEAAAGQRLLERRKGGTVELTPAGRDLLHRGREMLSLNDDILRALRASNEAQGEPSPHPEPHNRRHARPNVAVMPFRNLSGDSQQDHFAAGVTLELTTALSRIKWLTVIARPIGSPAHSGGDARNIGSELGARYLLQGGVEKSTDRVRIRVQLVDANRRSLVWAGTFDGPLGDIFSLRDDIADQVVGIVEPRLQRSEIERARTKPTRSLDAYELYLRALPHVAAQMPADARIALDLLRQSLKLDPHYAAAHAMLAWSHELCFTRDGLDPANRAAAIDHARAALTPDNEDAATLAVAGFVLNFLRDGDDDGLVAIDRALTLNPSSATALHLGAQAYAFTGHGRSAGIFATRALKLSPTDPLAFEAHLALGETALSEGRLDDADWCFANAARANPRFSTSFFYRAAARALAGAEVEAAKFASRFSALEPNFRLRAFHELGADAALMEKLRDASRKLGLPE
jgi:adenylate cyclase